MEIVIYGTGSCPYCVKAQEFLTKLDLLFTYFDISQDKEKQDKVRQEWAEKEKPATVPAIWIDDIFIGGFTDLKKYFSQ